MTDSLTGGLRLGLRDRVMLSWGGERWSAVYFRDGGNGGPDEKGYFSRTGLPNETAGEVVRGLMFAAQLNEATR